MKAHSLRLLALSSFGLVGACAAEGPQGPLTVEVAPLTLPGIADVCYGLTVFNGSPATSPDTVWSLENVCSTQYGNGTGGDITYIGTCDADSGQNNYVQLILESIEDTNGNTLTDQITAQGGDSDFINPCAEAGDCLLNFPCIENEDVLVEFNISVMRDAEQGFFDIAVNFEDIFCSAKADSCYDADSPITLLYGDDDNDTIGRDHTLVVGFACTAGPDFVNSQGTIIEPVTQLIMTAPLVSCTSATGPVTFEIPLTGEGGNGSVTGGRTNSYTLHYGVYFDEEDLNCGEVTVDGTTTLVHQNSNGRYYYRESGVLYYATFADGFWQMYNDATGEPSVQNWPGVAGEPGPFAQEFNQTSQTYIENPKFGAVMVEVAGPGGTVDLSCNKAFFNFAIDIENLSGQGLQNCTLNYGATAQDGRAGQGIFSVVNGQFVDSQSVYGAVSFVGVKLTDEIGDTVCDAHPLNGDTLDGEESNVTSVYVFGDAYDTEGDGQGNGGPPPRYFATSGGAAQLIGNEPQK